MKDANPLDLTRDFSEKALHAIAESPSRTGTSFLK
jgi:hypothetical protein